MTSAKTPIWSQESDKPPPETRYLTRPFPLAKPHEEGKVAGGGGACRGRGPKEIGQARPHRVVVGLAATCRCGQVRKCRRRMTTSGRNMRWRGTSQTSAPNLECHCKHEGHTVSCTATGEREQSLHLAKQCVENWSRTSDNLRCIRAHHQVQGMDPVLLRPTSSVRTSKRVQISCEMWSG